MMIASCRNTTLIQGIRSTTHDMPPTEVPSFHQLIPYIIWSLLALVSGFGVWLLRSLIPKIEELIKAIHEMKDEHKNGHSALTQALLVLTFKVNNPESDVSNEASKITYPADEKK